MCSLHPVMSPAQATALIRLKQLLTEPGLMANHDNKDKNISEVRLSPLRKVASKKGRRSLEENNSGKGWDENHWKAAGVLNSPRGELFKVSKGSSSAGTNAKWEWTAERKEPSMHFSFCFLWITSETRCWSSLNAIGHHNLVRIKHICSKASHLVMDKCYLK